MCVCVCVFGFYGIHMWNVVLICNLVSGFGFQFSTGSIKTLCLHIVVVSVLESYTCTYTIYIYVCVCVCVCAKHQSSSPFCCRRNFSFKIKCVFLFPFRESTKEERESKAKEEWGGGGEDSRRQLHVEVSKAPSGGGRWRKFTSITMRNERKFVECANSGRGCRTEG